MTGEEERIKKELWKCRGSEQSQEKSRKTKGSVPSRGHAESRVGGRGFGRDCPFKSTLQQGGGGARAIRSKEPSDASSSKPRRGRWEDFIKAGAGVNELQTERTTTHRLNKTDGCSINNQG